MNTEYWILNLIPNVAEIVELNLIGWSDRKEEYDIEKIKKEEGRYSTDMN